MRFKPGVSLAVCGAAIGGLAVALEAWGGLYPPHAYGFCTTCHGQDLVGWLVSRLSGTQWGPGGLGVQTVPLTVVGVLLGGYLAAALADERRSAPTRHPWRSIVLGMLAANLGLLALGCPIRQVLLLGYGDWVALPAMLGYLLAVGIGTVVWKRRVARAA